HASARTVTDGYTSRREHHGTALHHPTRVDGHEHLLARRGGVGEEARHEQDRAVRVPRQHRERAAVGLGGDLRHRLVDEGARRHREEQPHAASSSAGSAAIMYSSCSGTPSYPSASIASQTASSCSRPAEAPARPVNSSVTWNGCVRYRSRRRARETTRLSSSLSSSRPSIAMMSLRSS